MINIFTPLDEFTNIARMISFIVSMQKSSTRRTSRKEPKSFLLRMVAGFEMSILAKILRIYLHIMFWLRNAKTNFQLRNLIWRPG